MECEQLDKLESVQELEKKFQNVVIDKKSIKESHGRVCNKNRKSTNENLLNEDETVTKLPNGSTTPTSNHTDTPEIASESTETRISPKCSLAPEELETIQISRDDELFNITYKVYESELELPSIMKLIQKDLSEPYSIYTYRYFIHNWPKLCYMALHENKCVGCIVCKLDIHREMTKRGYIAMLAVDKDYRKLKIGTTLVQKAIRVMIANKADEVVLETEITNQPALKLYENLGFVRDKRLFHYYLNGVDALRLKLWFR